MHRYSYSNSSSAHGNNNMVGHYCSCGLFHPPNQCSSSSSPSILWPHSPSVVDCTLSLGNPSTRLSSTDPINPNPNHRRSISHFCWDFLHPKPSPASPPSCTKPSDPLLARRCANCDTTSTPLWRNGPKGPKSLCNACGIRFKKEERRAAAAAATTTGSGGYYQHLQPQKGHYSGGPIMMGNDLRFMDHDDSSDSGIHFLSWRLNVTADRPTPLLHHFTR